MANTNIPFSEFCRYGLVATFCLCLFATGVDKAGNMTNQEIDGVDLYKIVETYSKLGIHRVGTAVDARTVDWFTGKLERLGGKVERQSFEFTRFDGTSTVTFNGESVPSIPLYYVSAKITPSTVI